MEIGALMRELGTGLLVTELMGQGVNGVTGDYSRGASGYWVENGVQAYPVHEITIAGQSQGHVQATSRPSAATSTCAAACAWEAMLVAEMTIAGD